jgi:hypothetical protein
MDGWCTAASMGTCGTGVNSARAGATPHWRQGGLGHVWPAASSKTRRGLRREPAQFPTEVQEVLTMLVVSPHARGRTGLDEGGAES